jgi:putative oxidoreductase
MHPSTHAHHLMLLAGRVLTAPLFVISGWGKIVGFSGVVAYTAAHGVPQPEAATVLAVAAELGLGLLLLAGWQARHAAWCLAIFTGIVTPLFHGFWAAPAVHVEVETIAFFKNLAIVGGLLAFAVCGAGRFSVDARRAR